MHRYVVVSIVVALLLVGCTPLPLPSPTEATYETIHPAPAGAAPPPPQAASVAITSTAPAPIDTAPRASAPTIVPTDTLVPPSPTAILTPAPTEPPTSPPPTNTAVPSPTPVPGAAWRGEYFASSDFSGEPALVRFDRDIRFDWGLSPPAPGLPADHFSVRWTRPVSFGAGRWRFHATSDDGVRVFVDGLPIIDQWHTAAGVTYNTSLVLSEGYHALSVAYFDNTELASIYVWWEPDDGSATDPSHAGAWRGDYFDNRGLSGTPAFGRDDPAVYFDWGQDGPSGMDGYDFSVRWTRQLFFPAGRYLFKARADDGVRVWFDWVAIIDEWHDSSGQDLYTREVDVGAGDHTVVVEYYQGGGNALVQVTWEPANVSWVANLHTCLALQDSWIKVYRLTSGGQWEDLRPEGYGPMAADGSLSLFGLPIDATYGWEGQPYRVELWINGSMVRSEGDIAAGQPAFTLSPGEDARTSWPCGAELPRP